MSEFQKKSNYTEKTAKSVDEAKAAALRELGITESEAVIEILSEGTKGFFGIGAKEAVVRVTVKEKTEDAPSAAPEKPISAAAASSVKSTVYDGLSYEETAKKFLSDIFSAMKLEVEIETKTDEDNTISVTLSGENMGIIIGKRGDTLDSLQYLTSLVVNQKSEDYIKVSIDTENYREKRTEALLALSNRLAEKVARTGKRFTLEPMNPYERRVIHANLQGHNDVTTYSVGSEPYRKVVIAPKGAKPYHKKRSQGGYRKKPEPAKETAPKPSLTYKADFKPQQHKAEYKSIDEYFADHSED